MWKCEPHVRMTNPLFTAAFHTNTRSSTRPQFQPTRRTTRLGPSPFPDRPMFVGVLGIQRAQSRTRNILEMVQKPSVIIQLVQPQPPGREEASLEDRGTHLRHSSSCHCPPSLRCASVEPNRPGAYGAPRSSRRLSA